VCVCVIIQSRLGRPPMGSPDEHYTHSFRTTPTAILYIIHPYKIYKEQLDDDDNAVMIYILYTHSYNMRLCIVIPNPYTLSRI